MAPSIRTLKELQTPLPAHTQLGAYELLRLLASGGMADIYLARTAGNELCAVKVMNQRRVHDPEACALFLDEGRVLGLLAHENLTAVKEVAREEHCYFMAMDFVHGADCRELLAAAERGGTAIPHETAVAIVAAAAAGLDHAHRCCDPEGKPLRLVHRDVSLSNIMIGYDGAVKVIDFGIACATVSAHHTEPGIVRGKASYMAPEQALGDDVDLRTDVFALGVVLYELATGKRCFNGNSDWERMIAVTRGEYVRPSELLVCFPPALEAVITKALATDRTERFASAAALLQALVAVARDEGWTIGAPPIVDVMRQLFGTAANPLEREVLEPTNPTVIYSQRRRLGNGTQAELDADDEPTRGRRSLPAIFVARAAA